MCDLDALAPALILRLPIGILFVYDIFDKFADKITNLPTPARGFPDLIDRALVKCASAVTITDEHRRKRIGDISFRRVEVIMNVPAAVTLKLASRDHRQFRICYAGNIHEHRGLPVIAKAQRDIKGVEVFFAGWITRPEDKAFLRQQPMITFLGKLSYEDSLSLIAGGDSSLALYDPSLPINVLGSSNKIFEAMSMRKPIITNRETTMAPIVEREECDLLVPYGDV